MAHEIHRVSLDEEVTRTEALMMAPVACHRQAERRQAGRQQHRDQQQEAQGGEDQRRRADDRGDGDRPTISGPIEKIE